MYFSSLHLFVGGGRQILKRMVYQFLTPEFFVRVLCKCMHVCEGERDKQEKTKSGGS